MRLTSLGRVLAPLAATLAAACASGQAVNFEKSAAKVDIAEGRRFPDLRLPRLETGEPGSIADYRGERLVLHVFASW